MHIKRIEDEEEDNIRFVNLVRERTRDGEVGRNYKSNF